MQRRQIGLLGLSALVLMAVASGCVNVQNSKVLTIRPTEGPPVTVTSTARAQCRDVFFVMWCTLNMEMTSSNGERVSDFPTD